MNHFLLVLSMLVSTVMGNRATTNTTIIPCGMRAPSIDELKAIGGIPKSNRPRRVEHSQIDIPVVVTIVSGGGPKVNEC
jgi:hypothetical protein